MKSAVPGAEREEARSTIISTGSIIPPGKRQPHRGSFSGASLVCTPDEREALVKVASGDTRISREHMRRLFMLRLVERELGVVQLTREGRQLLGLAD